MVDSDWASLTLGPFLNLEHSSTPAIMAEAISAFLDSEHFDSWGAMMIPSSAVRDAMCLGGLRGAVPKSTSIDSSNERWNKLATSREAGTLSPSNSLFLARLLLYAAFPREVEAILHQKWESAEQELWAKGLRANAERTDISKNTAGLLRTDDPLITAVGPGRALFYFALTGCGQTVFKERRMATEWLSLAGSCVKEGYGIADGNQASALAQSRIDHFQAVIADIDGDWVRAHNIREAALERLKPLRRTNEPLAFPARETQRRILERMTIAAIGRNAISEAWESAQKLVDEDPFCSHALLLAGEIARKASRPTDAERFFWRAYRAGLLERPYCARALAELADARPTFSAYGGQAVEDDWARARQIPTLILPRLSKTYADTLMRNWLKTERTSRTSAPSSLLPPISLSVVRGLMETRNSSEQQPWQEKIRHTLSYARLLPFWELRTINEVNYPIYSKTPLLAWDAVNTVPTPWFTSVFQQRTMGQRFREELVAATVAGAIDAPGVRDLSRDLKSLARRSTMCDQLLELIAEVPQLNPLRRSYVARVVAYLGFPDKAAELLCVTSVNKTPDQAFEAYTALFIEHLIAMGRNNDLGSRIDNYFRNLPNADEFLRLRVNACILGLVWETRFARRTLPMHQSGAAEWTAPDDESRRSASAVAIWKERVDQAIVAYTSCPSVSSFEADLMASRVHRAASFFSFITGDHAELQCRIAKCERLARSLRPSCTTESAIYRDNLFAVLETTSRAHLALGDRERSEAAMRELATSVDPLDPKAWLQYGDLLSRLHGDEEALPAFLEAGRLGVPLGMIAWYRAGRCLERLGERRSAIEAHLFSLRLWSEGVSPLRDIRRLTALEDDALLEKWATERLAHLETRRATKGCNRSPQ